MPPAVNNHGFLSAAWCACVAAARDEQDSESSDTKALGGQEAKRNTTRTQNERGYKNECTIHKERDEGRGGVLY